MEGDLLVKRGKRRPREVAEATDEAAELAGAEEDVGED